ncbi:MAG: cytochrome bc1 complex diheme cytochrome c subunit [Acidimicrobiales bacterium]
MSALDRRHRRQRRGLLFMVAVAGAVATTLLVGHRSADAQGDLRAQGRQLYLVGCVSCHGTEGKGVGKGRDLRGPSLQDAGEASAYYQLSTGRMPLSDPNADPKRAEPSYDPDEIRALVAYVASLGNGPMLPALDLENANLAAGGATYRANCQACHGATGAGGALSYGRAAPSLQSAEPRQIAAAMRSGPGQMPVFGPATVKLDEVANVVTYVRYLQDPRDPGGLPIGRVGPVPEGFIAWSVGVVLLLVCVYWIGTRSLIRRRSPPHDDTSPPFASAQGGAAPKAVDP